MSIPILPRSGNNLEDSYDDYLDSVETDDSEREDDDDS